MLISSPPASLYVCYLDHGMYVARHMTNHAVQMNARINIVRDAFLLGMSMAVIVNSAIAHIDSSNMMDSFIV